MRPHRRTLHGGTQLTLATLRQRYWILQGRQRVKALIHRCPTCIRWRATTGQQLMGDLPAPRVTPARPFQHVGVDYAGPVSLLVVRGRGQCTHKGYVALFICLSTRAVHLELVSDCSTEAFIAALRRFTSRRGLCTSIQSDQGTNFVGADRVLREMLALRDNRRGLIHSTLLKEGIEWRFKPPAAPHFGRLWEAAVKSTKYHLRRVIGEQHLTFEELSTLLHQIEACLNSRPFIAMSDDPGDLSVLTPGHFLIGDALLSLPDPAVEDVPHQPTVPMASAATNETAILEKMVLRILAVAPGPQQVDPATCPAPSRRLVLNQVGANLTCQMAACTYS